MGVGLNTGIMAAVPLALTPRPHNSVFPSVSLAPLKLPPSARAQDECLWESESVQGAFKRISGFPAAFFLSWMGRTLADFHSQILPELLFLAVELWARGPMLSWDPSLLWGDLCSQDYMWVKAQVVLSLCTSYQPLLVWSGLFFIPLVKNSVQLVFRWFSKLIFSHNHYNICFHH